jgi:hypothetical protein
VSSWLDRATRDSYVPDEEAMVRNYHLNVELRPYQQQVMQSVMLFSVNHLLVAQMDEMDCSLARCSRLWSG